MLFCTEEFHYEGVYEVVHTQISQKISCAMAYVGMLCHVADLGGMHVLLHDKR